MIAMKLWEIMRNSLLSAVVVATIGISIFGTNITEARYLPTRGKTDGLDRLRDLLRDILETDVSQGNHRTLTEPPSISNSPSAQQTAEILSAAAAMMPSLSHQKQHDTRGYEGLLLRGPNDPESDDSNDDDSSDIMRTDNDRRLTANARYVFKRGAQSASLLHYPVAVNAYRQLRHL